MRSFVIVIRSAIVRSLSYLTDRTLPPFSSVFVWGGGGGGGGAVPTYAVIPAENTGSLSEVY